MQYLATILLKSIVTTGLLLAYYLLFLRNKKLHQYNRMYLLTAVAAGILIPLVHMSWYVVNEITAMPAIKIIDAIQSGGAEEMYLGEANQPITLTQIALGLYAIVSLMILVQSIRKIVWLYKIKQVHPYTKLAGYTLIHTHLKQSPFSFLNNLYWNDEIDMNSATGKQILEHELTHIRQVHTMDKLFMQLVVVICWINPLFWYVRQELSLTHEFLADDNAIKDNNSSSLANMLLAAQFKINYPPIVNPFYSSTKRRIMMFKTNTTRFARLRKAAALPLLLLPVALFSFTIKHAPKAAVAKHKMTLILDAGHGGMDRGSTSKKGIEEKDITLKICNKIAAMASKYNLNVVLTRDEDKNLQLQQRVDAANNIEEAVFVSVHINKSIGNSAQTAKDPNGFEVYITEKNSEYAKSKLLASAIMQQLTTIGKHTQLYEQGLTVLKRNNHPAVLIECGNMDNSADEAMLNSDVELGMICREILNGVVAYTNVEKK